jgi:2'-5' RNA ligase
MRVFFALEIDNATKTEISRWRDIALPDPGRPVQSENFHITLDFLGEVTPAVLDQLVNAADHILRPDFDLTLDEAGYFAKAGVYWIA